MPVATSLPVPPPLVPVPLVHEADEVLLGFARALRSAGLRVTHDRAAVFLDAQMRVIAFKEMFRGSITQTAVYPREVVKEALALNAAGVILAHNHPSGSTEPSRSDEYLTQALKAALSLVDVRVLDHLIVTAGGITSFAERGLL